MFKHHHHYFSSEKIHRKTLPKSLQILAFRDFQDSDEKLFVLKIKSEVRDHTRQWMRKLATF